MKKNWILISLAIIGCFLSLWIYALWIPVVKQDGATYYLRPGTSKKVFITELSQQDLIPFPAFFSIYFYFFPNTQLKTGEYYFPKNATPYSILQQVLQGKGLLYHPFTIVPGWSFHQLLEELSKVDGLRHSTKQMTDTEIMTALGFANLPPEGEFYPDTYYYTKGISDLIILKRSFSLMQKKLSAAWQTRAANLPFTTPYEALIAASLIEKEAYLSSERPIIAGVLVNRLQHHMLLQFDPTVIYGMGARYNGKLHKENLHEDTPYNTYVHLGLPPTPIAMPSLASIDAVMHPAQHNYFYFVAKGDGSHQFSKTLDEHNTAVSNSLKPHISYFNENAVQSHLNLMMHVSPHFSLIL